MPLASHSLEGESQKAAHIVSLRYDGRIGPYGTKTLTALQYLHLFCLAVYGYVTVYVLWKAPRNQRSLAFASLTFCFFIWSSSLLLVHNPAMSQAQASVGYNIGAVGWSGFASIALWFALVFSGRHRTLERPVTKAALFVPPLLVLLAQWLGLLSEMSEAQTWGWGYRWALSPWSYFFFAYYVLYMGLALYCVGREVRVTGYPLVRRQGNIIVGAAIMPFGLATLSDVTLPLMGIRSVPNIGPAFLLFWVVGSAFAILRYGLVDFTPRSVANELVGAMKDGVLLVDPTGRIAHANPAAETLLCRNVDELRAISLESLLAAFGHDQSDDELRLATSEGDTVFVSVSRAPVHHQRGPLGTLYILRDVSAYKESQEELEGIREALEDRVEERTKDLDDALEEIRRAAGTAETLHACARAVHLAIQEGRTAAELGTSIADELQEAFDSFEGCSIVVDHERSVSSPFLETDHVIISPIIVGGKARGRVEAFVRHEAPWVEQRRVVETVAGEVASALGALSLQNALSQSERLAAVGLLAAGVAHEINNPLTYVIQSLEDIDDRIGDAESIRLGDALGGCERIRRIVADLGSFSRARDETSVFCVNDPVEVALAMASNEIRHRASLDVDLRATHGLRADSGRLSQVFVNLLTNAAHAIEEGNTESNVVSVESWDEARHACVAVSDTGVGIPDDDIVRLFDPFFSTKATGVGLGLAICHDIVEAAGGSISVERRERGTRFVVRLPAVRSEVPEPVTTGPTPVEDFHRARVLIIDDDVRVARALARILHRHDCVIATGGIDGRDILREDHHFDIILCDVMMPDMSGPELYRWLEEKDSATAERVYFITGGAFGDRGTSLLEQMPARVIAKPFDRFEVRSLVERVAASKPCMTRETGTKA